MPDTPQRRSDGPDDDLGTTPDAPQGRTDEEQADDSSGPPASTDGGDADQLQPPITRDEVERRQLDE